MVSSEVPQPPGDEGETSRPSTGGTADQPGWSSSQPNWSSGEVYPRQELLPQAVVRSRSRLPIFAGIGVVLALVIAGVTTYAVIAHRGGDRTAYCNEIRRVAPGKDLAGSTIDSAQDALDELATLQKLAPAGVAGDWKTLANAVHTFKANGQPDIGTALAAYGALKAIVDDANAHCGTNYQLPTM